MPSKITHTKFEELAKTVGVTNITTYWRPPNLYLDISTAKITKAELKRKEGPSLITYVYLVKGEVICTHCPDGTVGEQHWSYEDLEENVKLLKRAKWLVDTVRGWEGEKR